MGNPKVYDPKANLEDSRKALREALKNVSIRQLMQDLLELRMAEEVYTEEFESRKKR
jgi:hypothetical protein